MSENTKGRTMIGTVAGPAAPGSRPRSTTGAPHPMPPHAAPRASIPIPTAMPASSVAIPAAQVLVDLAYAKLELRRFDEAFDALDRALCLDVSLSGHVSPTLPPTMAERVLALKYVHRLQAAGDQVALLDQLRRLTLRYPDSTPILFNYAVELDRTGAHDLARDVARRTIQQSPLVLDTFPPSVRKLLAAGPPAAAAGDARVGATLGGYKVLRVATSAPSHVLYDAVHGADRTPVTLRQLCNMDPGKARALFAAQVAASAAPRDRSDPRRYLVRALDVIDDAGMPLQVLERVRGRTVHEAFADPPRTPEALELGLHVVWLVARAAAELHSDSGFLHGRLGTDHVVFADDSIEQPIRLLDTGLDAQLRGGGTLPMHSAPDHAPSVESEVHGLGRLLHYVATGTLPERGWIRREDLRIDHDEIRHIVFQCLAAPGERYTSAAMVASALETAFVADAVAVREGQLLDQWRIEAMIRTERYANVYRAKHLHVPAQFAALRVLRASYVHHREVRHRFELEAAITPQHPGIVELWPRRSFLTGTPYYAMKLVDGQPLRERIAAAAIPVASALDWALELADTLAFAHDDGVFHLDVTPDGVLVVPPGGPRRTQLTGFGIARVRSLVPRGEQDGTGSPAYMAPEQLAAAEDRAQLAKVDVYSLGVVMIELLTGNHPQDRRANLPYQAVIAPDQLAGLDLPLSARRNLEYLIEQMTAEQPAQRPRMQDVRVALEQIARNVPGTSAHRTMLPGHPATVEPVVPHLPPRGASSTRPEAGDGSIGGPWQSAGGAPSTRPDGLVDAMLGGSWPHPAPTGRGSESAPTAPEAWVDRVSNHEAQIMRAPREQQGAEIARADPGPAIAPARRHRRTKLVIGALAAAIAAVAIWLTQRERSATPMTPGPERIVDRPVERPVHPPADLPIDYDLLRKDAQTLLRASLREPEPAVRVQGSDALGKLKDQPSEPALTTMTERDPDGEVRGHSAEALGEIGTMTAAPLLARLESAAAPPLKVWYAAALARLGDRRAPRRLLGYAHSRDLDVSFKAATALAAVSSPGDRAAIAALRALASHEAELDRHEPYAGALLLARLAALRDLEARKLLYQGLEHHDEGARLAAAEGLARLGDEAGKKVLQDVLANQASPNRLVAAVAQIPLGDYGGLDVIVSKLDDKDPGIRRLAARGLGEIGERKSLPRLVALERDADWTVRIAAARAIATIVGLDPQVLAQASVNWTRSALASQDLAVRKAAAGVLADIPVKEAVPLLAQAIADPDPKVRLVVARSAGKIKSAEAATRVAEAVKTETDPQVKEQEVKALGEIGAIASSGAHDTLALLSDQPGRLGVLAAGALIAVGDSAGKLRLDAAVAAPQTELRLAAMQAAASANNPIVVPTLKLGVLDRIFDVRFAAAEGLAMFHAEKAAAVPVLTQALSSSDAGIVGRALAALTRLGEKIATLTASPASMLDSADPRQRLAVADLTTAMAPSDGAALLRRLVADPDQEVRRAGVEAIAAVALRNRDLAIRLYKPLVSDADPMVRSKAAGQLSRLVVPPPPQPVRAPITAAAAPPPPDVVLAKVKPALDDVAAAAAEAHRAVQEVESVAAELTAALGKHTHDDATLARVAELKRQLDDAPARLEAAAAKVEVAAQAAADAGGPGASPDVAKLVNDAQELARTARSEASATRDRATAATASAGELIKAETSNVSILIGSADAATVTGNFTAARYYLDKAARQLREAGTKDASLDYSYAQLYDKMAAHTQDPQARRKLLQQAGDAYQRFAATGTGPHVQQASDRRREIADELREPAAP